MNYDSMVGSVVYGRLLVELVKTEKGRKRFKAYCRLCGVVTMLRPCRLKRERPHCRCVISGKTHPMWSHGDTGSAEYNAHKAMHRRCYDPKHNRHINYMGISVCSRWRGAVNYPVFLSDMGRRPSSQHSLDRIDNKGDYEPGNCRWATSKEQARNRNSTDIVEYKGIKKPLIEWAEDFGVAYYTVRKRFYKLGWSLEESFNGSKRSRRPRKTLTIDGVTRSVIGWSKQAEVSVETFRARIKKLGWTPKEALAGNRVI
jgi:hypothetical protein